MSNGTNRTIYGIDLGTTNSLLALNGKPIGGLFPSIVVHQDASRRATAKMEEIDEWGTSPSGLEDGCLHSFKANVTSGAGGLKSVKASAIVLRDMKEAAAKEGYDVREVVISVPAAFREPQRVGTREAAMMAGLEVVRIVNEPTAAAMVLSDEDRGYSDYTVVFDLGGGTFDMSIVEHVDNKLRICNSEGIIQGGDDLDRAIMEYIAEHGLGVNSLVSIGEDALAKFKVYVRNIKHAIQLAGEGESVLCVYSFNGQYGLSDLNMTLTYDAYQALVRRAFKESFITAKNLLRQSGISASNYKVLLVGGSTRCPVVKGWVLTNVACKHYPEDERIIANDDGRLNPDLLVGVGASVYGQQIAEDKGIEEIIDITQGLWLDVGKVTLLPVVTHGSQLPVLPKPATISNAKEHSKVYVAVYQGESNIKDEKDFIGQLIYDYGCVKKPGEGVVDVDISVDANGLVSINAIEKGTFNAQSITIAPVPLGEEA